MTNDTQERALAYLSECAKVIAPVWEPHIMSEVPPQTVIDYFDTAVDKLLGAEPDLPQTFGFEDAQRADLASHLLDIVIDRARQEVGRIRQAKAAAATATNDAELSPADFDAQAGDAKEKAGKEVTRQERMAYLRAKRDAKIAEEKAARDAKIAEEKAARDAKIAEEKAAREAKIAEARRAREERILTLVRGSELVDTGGALRRREMDALSENLATLIAARWTEHGGQGLSAELKQFFYFLAKTLLRGTNPDDGTWDVRMDDGSVHRHRTHAELSSLYSNVIGQLVLAAAKPHFTYEQETPWGEDELMSIAEEAVRHRVDLLARAVEAEAVLAAASRSLAAWQELHPAPPVCPYGVSPEGAEAWCCDWLIHMGMVDAEVTRLTGDGGVDVVSSRYIVQVKHYTGSVSIAELRELVGVAAVEGKKPVFMTSGSYPAQAEEFADRAGMLLFRYDVTAALVEGATGISTLTIRTGFLDE